jgi:hypothetical protein
MCRRPQPRGFSSAAVFIVGGLLIAIGVGYVVFASRQADVATEQEAAEIKKQAAVKAAPKSAAPQVPDNFILTPQFETSTGVFQAGTAFVIKLPNLKRPVVLTAIHLFGPAGGLPNQLSAGELSGFVKRANFYNIFENKEQVCTSDIRL